MASSHFLHSFSSPLPSPIEVSVLTDLYFQVHALLQTWSTSPLLLAERKGTSSGQAEEETKKSKSSEEESGEKSRSESTDEVSIVLMSVVVHCRWSFVSSFSYIPSPVHSQA